MVGSVYEQALAKTHAQTELCNSSAGMPCFVQQNGVLMFGEVLKVVGSCFRSGLMFGKCSRSLLWLVVAAMRDDVQNAKLGCRLPQAPQACCK